MIEKFGNNHNQFPLNNPCMIDLKTKAGFLTLMMDKDYPFYLFVSFNGELRKCVELEDQNEILLNDHDVFEFLHKIKSTPLVRSLIEEEKKLNPPSRLANDSALSSKKMPAEVAAEKASASIEKD